MRNYDMILIKRQLKYQLYHQAKFINMNISTVKIYLLKNKLDLLILLYEKLSKNKWRQLKIKRKKQVEALNILKSNSQLTIEDLISKNALNNDEAKRELDKINK